MGKTFWKDGFQGKTKGGYYFRAFDLVKFFKRLKDSGEEVVGLEFDDSNNVNVIVESKDEEEKLFDDLLKQEEEYNKQEDNDED